MGTIADLFDRVYRDYVTDGVPASGGNEPLKPEMRSIGPAIEAMVGVQLGAVTVAKTTAALLGADLAHAAGTLALVYADATQANNDIWTKVGGSGSGSWTNTGALLGIMTALTAPFIDDLETASAALAETVAGPLTPDVSGTSYTNSSSYYWPTSEQDYDQILTKFEFGAETAGNFNILVARHEGDNTLTHVSLTLVAAEAVGSVVLDDLDIAVPAGCVVGFRTAGGSGSFTSGTIPGAEHIWSIASALPTSHTAYTNLTTNGVNFRATLAGEIAAKARIAYDRSVVLAATLGGHIETGWPDPIVGTGSTVPATYTIVMQDAADAEGFISGLTVGADVAATTTIYVVSVDTSTLAVTVHSATPIGLAAGVNVLSLQIPIAAGQYPAISGGYKFQNASNPEGIAIWVKNGVIADGDILTANTQHRYEVQFTLETGLYATGGDGMVGTGLDVLTDADSTGSADATADFSSARSAHPFPYVRPGTFAVTDLPANGGGLWGPGKIYVDDARFFIPPAPMQGNLYDRLRATLAPYINDGDVMTLIADSIGQSAYAPTGPDHWFSLFTAFANSGIAADEPIMTALRASTGYTPAFYGVTTSGTVSTGTNGPLGESLVLGTGASLSFVGAYEQVDVFYTQGAGAGTLEFKFNGGAAFDTVVAAGSTDLDKFSANVPTGQAASGTYSITATGAPVEITGLVRLGVKAAGTPKRLLTSRAAHGSYTFASFGAAQRAAIIKQATYAGGKCLPIIALGINDSFGTPPATLVANATALIDALEAAGVERIYGIPPQRPSAVWNGTYTGGRTYDGAVAPLRRLYLDRGVIILPLDGAEWEGEGLRQDGLHPNGPGHDMYGQRAVEGIAYS